MPHKGVNRAELNRYKSTLQRSTLRKKVNQEHHELMPREFRKWVWASGRKLKGLVRRREAEAELYMYG